MSSSPARAFAFPPVVPLDYEQLRWIASCAANLPSQTEAFRYNGEPGAAEHPITVGDGGAPAGLFDVTIPAFTLARPSGLASIRFEVPIGDDALLAAFDVAAGDYNSAFWSESAVEKFLIPYVAMLAGPHAPLRLHQLARAWNHFPDTMQVFGILHRNRPREGKPISLGEMFDVMYLQLEGASLHLASLADFLPHCLEVSPFEPGPVIHDPQGPPTLSYRTGEIPPTDTQLPSEYTLRRMAEYSSRFRQQPVYLLFNAADGRYDFHAQLPEDLEGQVVVPSYTPPTRGSRPSPARVELHADDGPVRGFEREQADAAFWGDGAMEHIFCPYYVSTYGRAALRELEKITDAWWGEGDQRSAMGGPEVFALVHLPKSDWDGEGPDGSAFHNFALVGRGAAHVLSDEWLGAGAVGVT